MIAKRIRTCPAPDCNFATRLATSGGLTRAEARDDNGRWHGTSPWYHNPSPARARAIDTTDRHSHASKRRLANGVWEVTSADGLSEYVVERSAQGWWRAYLIRPNGHAASVAEYQQELLEDIDMIQN